jgi:hypothetical protein
MRGKYANFYHYFQAKFTPGHKKRLSKRSLKLLYILIVPWPGLEPGTPCLIIAGLKIWS